MNRDTQDSDTQVKHEDSDEEVESSWCKHEWVERGDERTSYFSIRCKHCNADGLI